MPFQIHALPAENFTELFQLSDAELAVRRACRMPVEAKPGAPCRISLEDAEPGEIVLLVNHTHLDAASPYHASHAIFVRKGVAQALPAPGTLPHSLQLRELSLRALDADGMIRDAALVSGNEAGDALETLLTPAEIAEVHLHFAARGCYAARATRA